MWFPWFEKLRRDSRETKEMLQQEIASIREASQAREEKEAEIGASIAVAIKAAADTVPDYEKCQRKKEYRLQWGIFWITVVGTLAATGAAIGAFYYAGIARRQLCTMNQTYRQIENQTNLMQNQLSGTVGAQLTVNVGLSETGSGSIYNMPSAGIALQNMREMPATNIRMAGAISRASLPDLKPIGKPIPWNFRIERIIRKTGEVDSRYFPFEVSEGERNLIWDTKRTIRLDFTLTYNNGFEDITVDDHRCIVAARSPVKTGEMMQDFPVRCEDVPMVLKSIEFNKKQLIKNQKH